MDVAKLLGLEVAKTLGKGYYFTPLPYWHEETNYTWTKLDLQEGDNEIWVYYGSETATDESDGDSVFEFFDDFEGTELDTSKWALDSGLTYNMSGSVLTVDMAKGCAHQVSGGLEGKAITTRAKQNETDISYTGVFGSPMSSRYTAGNNANADATVLYMTNTNSTELYVWIGDGSSASYNVIGGASLSTSLTIGAFYTFEVVVFNDGVELYRNGSKLYENHSITWHKSLAWVRLGFFNDDSTETKAQSTSYDRIFIRKYSSSPPSISYSSEESGSWTIDGHTFTKRKKVTITSSQALSGYQIQLDYSQWGEPGIKIMRKVQVVGELG